MVRGEERKMKVVVMEFVRVVLLEVVMVRNREEGERMMEKVILVSSKRRNGAFLFCYGGVLLQILL